MLAYIQYFYPPANEVAKGYSNATIRPSHPCEHSRINIRLVLFLRNIIHWDIFQYKWTDSDTVDYQSVWRQKYISDLHYIKCLLFISISNLNCRLQSKIKGFRNSFISGPHYFPSLSMFIEGQSY
jgi:hypothetical protein